MNSNEKMFVNETIKALKKIQKNYQESLDTTKKYELIKKAVPFLVIQIETTIKVIDEYISQFESMKKGKR